MRTYTLVVFGIILIFIFMKVVYALSLGNSLGINIGIDNSNVSDDEDDENEGVEDNDGNNNETTNNDNEFNEDNNDGINGSDDTNDEEDINDDNVIEGNSNILRRNSANNNLNTIGKNNNLKGSNIDNEEEYFSLVEYDDGKKEIIAGDMIAKLDRGKIIKNDVDIFMERRGIYSQWLIAYLADGEEKEINILPDLAYNIAEDVYNVSCDNCSIILKMIEGYHTKRLAYEINAKRKIVLLRNLRINIKSRIYVDAENGKAVKSPKFL